MPAAPHLRFRLLLDAEHTLGPGKVDLLEAIAATGSIVAAGRTMGMSYKRAWQLADELNRSFAEPLIAANKGGERGGGAKLTATGEKVFAPTATSSARRNRLAPRSSTPSRSCLRASARAISPKCGQRTFR